MILYCFLHFIVKYRDFFICYGKLCKNNTTHLHILSSEASHFYRIAQSFVSLKETFVCFVRTFWRKKRAVIDRALFLFMLYRNVLMY